MHEFTDNKKRKWLIHLGVEAVKRVRAIAGHDPISIDAGGLLASISADPLILISTAYAIAKPEIDAAGVTAQDFADACIGEPLDQLTEIIPAEIIGFFPYRQSLRIAAAWLATDTKKRRDRNALANYVNNTMKRRSAIYSTSVSKSRARPASRRAK